MKLIELKASSTSSAPLDFFMLLWCIGSFISALAQFQFPKKLSEKAENWSYSAGWQREISLWNIGLITTLLQVVFRGNHSAKEHAVRGLVVLSFLLGTNHGANIKRDNPVGFHALLMVVNYFMAVLGTVVLWWCRPPS